ncbi:MAG: hypothetical protein JST55_10785 [Bacteroidetes bacterium]|nr:hypothetical protein [Bacteroidota bacterium]
MSIAELKKEIVKFVEASQDEQKLQFFYQSFKVDSDKDFWDELTEEEKEDILQAEKEIERGEFIDNEVVMDKLAQWISK